MTMEEFEKQIGPYIGKLWPSFKLTSEQAEVWLAKLKLFRVGEVRQGMADAYAETVYNTPRLVEVVNQIRAARKGQVGINATADEQERWKRDMDPNPRPLVELLPEHLRKK